jgi:chromosome segregation ATPase
VHLVSAAQKQALAAQQEADRSRQDAHHLRVAHDQACADRDAARQESLETSRQYAAMQQQWLQEYAQRLAADAAVASLEQEARRLSLELALTRDRTSNVQASLDVTVRALESARADVSALLSSTSWRISRPVRDVGKGLRWARRAVAALQAARKQDGMDIPCPAHAGGLSTRGVGGRAHEGAAKSCPGARPNESSLDR